MLFAVDVGNTHTVLGVFKGAERLGITDLDAHAARWRPWRAYATQHLWAALDHPINHLPQEDS